MELNLKEPYWKFEKLNRRRSLRIRLLLTSAQSQPLCICQNQLRRLLAQHKCRNGWKRPWNPWKRTRVYHSQSIHPSHTQSCIKYCQRVASRSHRIRTSRVMPKDLILNPLPIRRYILTVPVALDLSCRTRWLFRHDRSNGRLRSKERPPTKRHGIQYRANIRLSPFDEMHEIDLRRLAGV